ncbi:hypothetical protein QTO34_000011, partial [Cnephaeus nilssonii]
MCALLSLVGRCAQAKRWGWTQGQWPQKSATCLPHTLNAESNAEPEGLEVDSLVIEHMGRGRAGNKAPKMWPRTYRAHGRVSPHRGSPCHTEVILTGKKQKRLHRRTRYSGLAAPSIDRFCASCKRKKIRRAQMHFHGAGCRDESGSEDTSITGAAFPSTQVRAGKRSYSYALDRRPVLSSGGRSSSSTERAASGGTHLDRSEDSLSAALALGAALEASRVTSFLVGSFTPRGLGLSAAPHQALRNEFSDLRPPIILQDLFLPCCPAASRLRENNLLLLEATKFWGICYSSSGKRIQVSSSKRKKLEVKPHTETRAGVLGLRGVEMMPASLCPRGDLLEFGPGQRLLCAHVTEGSARSHRLPVPRIAHPGHSQSRCCRDGRRLCS